LGGPIKKDRTFFFGDFEGLKIRQGVPHRVDLHADALPGAYERLVPVARAHIQANEDNGVPVP
jgi:hypothetical protein